MAGILILLLGAFLPDAGDDPEAAEILRQAGVPGGLAVHAGAREVRFAADLARTGRWLVLVLAADEAHADRLRRDAAAAGAAGLVSVAVPSSPGSFPVADHAANLVVAPAEAAGEALRILVPVRGAAFLRHPGRWEKVGKPMPAGFDEWTHYFHGPQGNPVSRDTEVRPPNALRWIAGIRGHDHPGENEWRLAAGLAVSEWNYAIPGAEKSSAVVTEARDAFNGTLLWQQFHPQGVPSAKTRPLILTKDRLIRPDETDPGWRLAAYDPRTGEKILLYEHSLPARGSQWGRPRLEGGHAVLDGDALFCTGGPQARCLDASTGKVLWTFSVEAGELYHPVTDPSLNLVVVGRGGLPPRGCSAAATRGRRSRRS